MSTNCLVTKLKGVVDNDSLLKVGEYKFEGYQVFISTAGAVSVKARIIEGGVFSPSNTKEITVQSGTNYVVSEKSTIAINDDYKTNVFRGTYNVIDTSILKVRPMQFIECKLKGNLADLSNLTSLQRLLIADSSNKDLQGSLSDISNLTALVEINFKNCYSIWGDLNSLGSLTNLTKINFWGTGGDSDHITGSLESLVTAQRAAGRTSGTISICIYGYPNGVTFNGSVISTASAAAYSNLTWDANTITWNDTTINA